MHTEFFTHRHFYTQTLLYTDIFTHKDFCTGTLLHITIFTDRFFYIFRRRNFTAIFGDRTSLSCEKFERDRLKSQLYRNFWRSNLISYERVARDALKSQFYRNFWRSNLISYERVTTGPLKIAILPQLAIEPHFVRKSCISCRLVSTTPRLQEKNKKEGKSKRAREKKDKKARD